MVSFTTKDRMLQRVIAVVAGAALVSVACVAYAEGATGKTKISAQEYEKNYDECLDGMSFICKKELLTEEDAKKIAEIQASSGKKQADAQTIPAAEKNN